MGDLYRALGEGEKARDAYQSALAIAERLASREPDRADYQRDLAVSYYRMGLLGGDHAATYFTKAHNLLIRMRDRGILQPTDYSFIEELENRL